nr:LacI family DNA-binding transcriptional regulator [Auraticoccus cholistanensis]
MKDVAERAGVSVKTASNVINDHPHVRPSTRARVLAAIDELRYRPNESARQLKYGRAGFLALVLPHIDEPYFSRLAGILTSRCRERGTILLLEETGAELAAERLVLDGLRSHVIDGLVFSPLCVTADEIGARRDSSPLVLLGEADVPPGVDHVGVDSVAAARAMVEHLLQTGRRRIAVIGDAPSTGTASQRLEGWRQALTAAGLPIDRSLVRPARAFDRATGRAAMEDLLALPEPPDAVFCFNDQLAVGAIRACVASGVDVPGQVAVAGFDDTDEGRYCNPPLTTVAADLELLADETLRLLMARTEDRQRPAEHVEVPWRLELRESTLGRAAARAAAG